MLPAVPHMLDDYVTRFEQVFAAMGRRLNEAERQHSRGVLAEQLGIAFSKSQRSSIIMSYSAGVAMPLRYSVTAQHPDLSATYEHWVDTRKPPFFGAHADAKVLAVAREATNAVDCPVLDVGAGTGRDALAVARLGHTVDAVELTPKVVEILRDTAAQESMPLRVICEDVFRSSGLLRRDYWLIIVSEVVSDFRSVAEWRALLELAARHLRNGGKLLVNVFVAHNGLCVEDLATREFAQQVFSFFMTPAELAAATRGLPLELVPSASVDDYERGNLPADAWPPTPWYEEWVSGQDIFDLPREASPVTLMWLVLEKT